MSNMEKNKKKTTRRLPLWSLILGSIIFLSLSASCPSIADDKNTTKAGQPPNELNVGSEQTNNDTDKEKPSGDRQRGKGRPEGANRENGEYPRGEGRPKDLERGKQRGEGGRPEGQERGNGPGRENQAKPDTKSDGEPLNEAK